MSRFYFYMLLGAEMLGIGAFLGRGKDFLFWMVLWGLSGCASNLTANKLIKVSPVLYLTHSFRAFFAGILMASIIQEYPPVVILPLVILNIMALISAETRYRCKLNGEKKPSVVERIK